MKKLKLIHLFSGVGSPEVALKRIGIPFEITAYSEIDKFAIQSYKAIHGDNILNLGDITNIDRLPKCNLLIYGSPCQDFSTSGKQEGLFDKNGNQTRSGLLLEVKRLLDISKKNNELPELLLQENVKNLVGKKFKPDFDNWLDKLEKLGYNNYWQVLNAKDYGIPQNRERVFVVSIRKDIDKNGYIFPKKIQLNKSIKDILEECVDEKYYLSEYTINKIFNSKFNQEKTRIQGNICQTLLARDYKDPKYIVCEQRTDEALRFFKDNICGTLRTIDSCGDKRIIEKIQKIDIPQVVKIRKYPVNTEKLKLLLKEHKKLMGISNNYIATCLGIPQTKVEHWFRTDCCFAIPDAEYWYKLKELLLIKTDEFDEAIMTFEEKEGTFEKSNRCYFDTGISPTLTATSADEKIITDLKIRKLTPKECWRLMGFNDEDFNKAQDSGISNSQLYKQAGNSIVVDVLYYIFKELFIQLIGK